jgi:hypothetical protein
LELNVGGVVAAIQAVAPVMRSQHAGRIVNISSGTTMIAAPGTGAYAASKSAVNMISAVARKGCGRVRSVFRFRTGLSWRSSRRGELAGVNQAFPAPGGALCCGRRERLL